MVSTEVLMVDADQDWRTLVITVLRARLKYPRAQALDWLIDMIIWREHYDHVKRQSFCISNQDIGS